jgi:hypothetical protein
MTQLQRSRRAARGTRWSARTASRPGCVHGHSTLRCASSRQLGPWTATRASRRVFTPLRVPNTSRRSLIVACRRARTMPPLMTVIPGKTSRPSSRTSASRRTCVTCCCDTGVRAGHDRGRRRIDHQPGIGFAVAGRRRVSRLHDGHVGGAWTHARHGPRPRAAPDQGRHALVMAGIRDTVSASAKASTRSDRAQAQYTGRCVTKNPMLRASHSALPMSTASWTRRPRIAAPR